MTREYKKHLLKIYICTHQGLGVGDSIKPNSKGGQNGPNMTRVVLSSPHAGPLR